MRMSGNRGEAEVIEGGNRASSFREREYQRTEVQAAVLFRQDIREQR
jgi:hypothetical protein